MISRTSVFGALAFAISAIAYVPYTMSVLAGEAHPTLSSWISWGVMDVVILIGMLKAGEVAWQLVAYVCGISFVFSSALWKGAAMGWTVLDFVCLALVGLAIIAFVLTRSPNVLIVISLIAMVIGSIPTVVSVWRNPLNEPLTAWLLIGTGGVCGMLAIKRWTVAGALTPICFLGLQLIVLVLMFR